MNLRTDSLRSRLLLGTIVWIGLGVVVGGLLVSSLFRWNLQQGYHDELQVHIEELAALTVVDPQGTPRLLRRLSDPRFLPPDSGFYWQVDRDGYPTLASPSLGSNRFDPKFANAPSLHVAWTEGPHGPTLEYGRQVALPDGPPLRLLIATDKRLVDATMAEFDRSLWFSLAAFTLVLIAAGLFSVRFGLRPLDRLAKAVADIKSGRATRMSGRFPSEIEPLVTDLNHLIDSSTESVARSRLIAGNLAHGLRTPLAILLDEAESLREAGNSDAADTIMTEARKMQRQIDFHLARSRHAAAQPLPGQTTELRATLGKLAKAFSRLHRNREIEYHLTLGKEMQVACDPTDLTEILSNLLDNAGKWARSRCVISCRREGTSVVIEVEDDGPGLPKASIEAVFKAGLRLDDLTPGTGLGLAISRDLTRVYGGDVWLTQGIAGGLRACVRIPGFDADPSLQ